MKRILALGLSLVLHAHAWAQVAPADALKQFHVADGLQIDLFASEPMFANPTCIDIDHRGNVWVCESVNYRCHLRKKPLNRKAGDRIVVLEDTDHDGKADRAHTFYQARDFIAPIGIAIAPIPPDGKGVKVYVCHSPHIYVLEDRDGDYRADGPPKVLLTGFRGFDHDHGVHGIHFGPDGKLYFSVGDQGVDGIRDRWGKRWRTNNTDCRAGTAWRCNPDGTGVELLAHNFRNPYEPAVDSFGTMFISDNDDDGNQQTRICYVMYGGDYGYWPRGPGQSHWHEEQPGVVRKVLRTGFGSPTGMCWYEGTLLRDVFDRLASSDDRRYGFLLHTDAGPREVRCFVVRSQGAGYAVEKLNLATTPDNWFRPSDVCVAPDGSIFVSDWYDPGVGGHGMGDITRGRVYRITPKGHTGYRPPPLDTASESGLLAALASPNLARRQLAFAILKKAKSKVLARAVAPDQPPVLRARGYWIQSLRRNRPMAPLDDKDERLHAVYFRVMDQLGDGLKSFRDVPIPVDRLGTAARRELLIALRHAPADITKKYLYPLASRYDGKDHFYLAAIHIAVGTDPQRRAALLADFDKHFPEWNDRVARLVWELRPPRVIARLDRKLADPKVPDRFKGQIIDILATTEGTTGGEALLDVLLNDPTPEVRRRALANLRLFLPGKWASLRDSDLLRDVIDQLFDDEYTEAAIELIAAAELKPYQNQLIDIAWQGDDLVSRQAAVRGLGQFKNKKVVTALADLAQDSTLRRDALTSLGRIGNAAALAALQRIVTDRLQPIEARRDAVTALARSRKGSDWLLRAHKDKQLPDDLIPHAARLLRNSPYLPLRNRALLAFPPRGRIDLHHLPAIAELMPRRGDPDQGRQLFFNHQDLGCVRCHSIRGVGGNVGPDLSMIGKKASRENLFDSILHPDKAVADQFAQWVVLDRDGTLFAGLLVEETPDYIVIRDGFGKDNRIATADIENRAKSPKSVMPSDVVGFMSEQDLVDIVAFLQTLQTPVLTVDSWHILGPFAATKEADSIDPLASADRPDLQAEYAGITGTVRWQTIRPNGEGYVDLRSWLPPKTTHAVAFLYRRIESPIDQEGTLLVGSTDEVRIWLNGRLVHRGDGSRDATARARVTTRLRKGANTVLIRIRQDDGPCGFRFAILSSAELK